MVSLVEEGLLVLHIAVRVAMHFSAVGRRWNSMVVLEDVVLRLREYRSSCLTKLHVVERELVALLPASILRSVVGERCGTVGGHALAVVFAAIVAELSEVDIEVVEIDELIHAAERRIGRAVHSTKRRLCSTPRLAVHVGDADRGGERRLATALGRGSSNSASGGRLRRPTARSGPERKRARHVIFLRARRCGLKERVRTQ
jgi:hypothetical protein